MSKKETILFQRGICRNNIHTTIVKTIIVMHSYMTLSCTIVKRANPMRLAGT